MKRAIVCLAVFLVVFAAILPSPAFAGCCWWPGAVVGGIVYGAVALATLPLWALSAAFVPPPGPYPPPAYYGAARVLRRAPRTIARRPRTTAPLRTPRPCTRRRPRITRRPRTPQPPAYSAPPVQSAVAVGSQRVVTHAPSPAL